MDAVRHEAKKQIAIAGYRLTHVLTTLINSLPVPLSSPYLAEQQQMQQQSEHESKVDLAFLSWAATALQEMPLPRPHGILRGVSHLMEGSHAPESPPPPDNDEGEAELAGTTGVPEAEWGSLRGDGQPAVSEL